MTENLDLKGVYTIYTFNYLQRDNKLKISY